MTQADKQTKSPLAATREALSHVLPLLASGAGANGCLVTSRDIGKVYGMRPEAVCEWARNGVVPCFYVGRYLFDLAAVQAVKGPTKGSRVPLYRFIPLNFAGDAAAAPTGPAEEHA